MTYANGDTFEGEFKDGKCVFGTLISNALELTYEGGYDVRGMWHGQGYWRTASESYKGEWKNGAWFGEGTYIDASGDTYEGYFIGTKNSENVTKNGTERGKMVDGEFKCVD